MSKIETAIAPFDVYPNGLVQLDDGKIRPVKFGLNDSLLGKNIYCVISGAKAGEMVHLASVDDPPTFQIQDDDAAL